MSDFYKKHKKIKVPICFYTDEDFENKLSKIVNANVMCSISEDIIYED